MTKYISPGHIVDNNTEGPKTMHLGSRKDPSCCGINLNNPAGLIHVY